MRAFALSLVSAAILISTPCYAAGNAVTGAFVTHLHLEGDTVFVGFDATINNPDGCNGNIRVVLPSGMAGRENYISILTTAMVSGKHVSVWVDGCSWAPWTGNLPKVYAMQIVS
jgi:hypothetical protein